MIQAKKRHLISSVTAFIVIVFLLGAKPVEAAGAVSIGLGSIHSIVNLALAGIMALYTSVMGFALLQIIKYLIGIAQYTGFVDQESVVAAWSVVRDVANLVLVLVLLFIAFGTIFGAEQYSYKKLLPRLLAMAIAINFSRTIAGLLIDFGQVFMLTFVNAWAGAAGGNFINALHINELLQLNPSFSEADQYSVTVGYLLAGAVVTVSLIVMLAFAVILTLRIVTLWMLIVLSPIVFALSAWPSEKAKKHYGKWWDQFIDNIVVGPAVGFFIWLTLATIGSGNISGTNGFGNHFQDTAEKLQVGGQDIATSIALTNIGVLENFASYIIGIGMLIASIQMVQEMRVAGTKIGADMLNYAKKKSINLAKSTGRFGVRAATTPFKVAAERARVSENAFSLLATVLPSALGGAWALKKATGVRDARKKAYDEASGSAKGATLTELQSAARPSIVETPKAQAARAAALAELLSSSRTKQMTQRYIEQGMTEDDAKRRVQQDQKNIFAEYEKSVKGSYSPALIAQIGDIKKTRLDLLPDADVSKIAGGMDIEEARKLKGPALEAALPYLTANVRNQLKGGSKEQSDAVKKFEEGLGPEEKAKNIEQGLRSGSLRLDKITADEIKIPEVAALLARDDMRGARQEIMKDSNKAAALQEGIDAWKARELKKPDALSAGRYRDDILKSAELQLMSGGTIEQAYEYKRDNRDFATTAARDSFRTTLKGANKLSVVLSLDAVDIAADDYNNGLGEALAEELSISDIATLANQARTSSEKVVVRQVLLAVDKIAQTTKRADIVEKASLAKTHPVYSDIFRKFLPKKEKGGSGGGTPPTSPPPPSSPPPSPASPPPPPPPSFSPPPKLSPPPPAPPLPPSSPPPPSPKPSGGFAQPSAPVAPVSVPPSSGGAGSSASSGAVSKTKTVVLTPEQEARKERFKKGVFYNPQQSADFILSLSEEDIRAIEENPVENDVASPIYDRLLNSNSRTRLIRKAQTEDQRQVARRVLTAMQQREAAIPSADKDLLADLQKDISKLDEFI